jgi:biopolymer transport protein TolR
MASRPAHRRSDSVGPNLTPLIDVTFQLIIFFMLVNNIIAEENVPMLVPDLDDPKTRQLGEVQRITVNIVPMPFDERARLQGNRLDHAGAAVRVQIGALDQYAADDLEGIRHALEAVRRSNPQVEIMLRADAALYYHQVQPVMDAITAARIVKVNIVAMMPDANQRALSAP